MKFGPSLCFIGLCAVTAHAVADISDVFKPFVSDSLSYDDNLFRQNSSVGHVTAILGNNEKIIKDDVINQATVGTAVDYTLGRQRFNLNLSVSDNRFVNNSFLNNISSNDRAAWQWQFGKQFSGDIGYAYTRAMAGFTNTSFFGLDMITGNNPFANLNYTWHPRWKSRVGISWNDYQHSASQRQNINWQYATASLRVDYVTPSNNSLGLQYIFNDGNYPNRTWFVSPFVDNRYQQHDISTLLTWQITQKIRFNGSVGFVTRQNAHVSQRDYTSGTFNLALNWVPTDKTLLAITVWRQLSSWADVTASYVVTDGVSLSPMWQATPKLALTAKFSYSTLDYTGEGGVSNLTQGQRNDTLLNGQMSLVYKPIPNAELSLSYQGGTRDTVNPPFGFPLDYTFNSVSTSAMLKF